MNIILGKENAKPLSEKYVVLELDTFRIKGHADTVTAFCVADDVQLRDFMQIDQWKSLHEKLIENYRKRNWSYCKQALEHLQGKWNNQLDTFYQDLLQRIQDLEQRELPSAWDGVIDRS